MAQEHDRYRSRLRGQGIRENEPIDFEKLFWGDLEVWDTVRKCVVEKNEAGEWVPVAETARS